jgi:hypothetical protein
LPVVVVVPQPVVARMALVAAVVARVRLSWSRSRPGTHTISSSVLVVPVVLEAGLATRG